MDYDVSDKAARFLLPLAQRAEFAVPRLEQDLKGARMHVDPLRYLAFSLQKSMQIGLVLCLSMFTAGYILGETLLMYTSAGLLLLIPLIFLTLAYRPRVKAGKKADKLEEELPYALRHILIQVKSDISLFNALVSVTEGYGEASNEFQKIVNEINGGKSQIEALENSLERNQSLMYRKVVWQLINALKSGTDIGETLQTLVDNIIEDQRIEVEKYGEDLSPFILMYLMLGVIVPSLGVTIMIVLSSFTGFTVGTTMFYSLGAGMVLFQLIFINLIKTKRPDVKAA